MSALKSLIISIFLFLVSFWLLQINEFVSIIDMIISLIPHHDLYLQEINEFVSAIIIILSLTPYLDWYSQEINEFVSIIFIITAFGLFISSIISFVRPTFQNNNSNNYMPKDGIDYTDEEYSHNDKAMNNRFELYSDDLDAVIELKYVDGRIINAKTIFRDEKNDWISSRENDAIIDHNLIHLQMKLSKNRVSARLISGGNFDFNDSSDTGYTLLVSMKFLEKSLLDSIMHILSENNFGCLSSNYTIHAHMDAKWPTETEAQVIIQRIANEISETLV